jgi:hypothetical protein
MSNETGEGRLVKIIEWERVTLLVRACHSRLGGHICKILRNF